MIKHLNVINLQNERHLPRNVAVQLQDLPKASATRSVTMFIDVTFEWASPKLRLAVVLIVLFSG